MERVVIAVLLATCFALQVHDRYAAQDTAGLLAMGALAQSREDSLLVLYRLHALSRDDALLRRLPDPGAGASARELALLSALWAYRIPGSTPWNAVRFGRRSQSLLDAALRLDREDPLVALIDGQSLLYRPGIAGGDVRRGRQRLSSLVDSLRRVSVCAVPSLEAELWRWVAADRAGDDDAGALAEALLRQPLPPLYRRFLER